MFSDDLGLKYDASAKFCRRYVYLTLQVHNYAFTGANKYCQSSFIIQGITMHSFIHNHTFDPY